MDVYVVKNKKFDVRINSRSGGFFSSISDYIIDKNGVVYGVILDEEKKVKHVRSDNKKIRDLMRGSKYCQSSLSDIFISVKNDLLNDKLVLFTGTSCQVAGLNAFLRNINTDNLITIDIICHGVISQKILDEYIHFVEKKYKKQIVNFIFRNKKKYGWIDIVSTDLYSDGTFRDSKDYSKIYYSNYFNRECCYVCKYKSVNRESDITIGDAWGIENNHPEFNDNNGISLVLINSIKGNNIFNEIKEDMDIIKTNISLYSQPALNLAIEKPKKIKFYRKIFTKCGVRIVLLLLKVRNVYEFVLKKVRGNFK